MALNFPGRLGMGLQGAGQSLMQLQAMLEGRKQRKIENDMAMQKLQLLLSGQNQPGLGQGELPGSYGMNKASPVMNQRSPFAGYGMMEAQGPVGGGAPPAPQPDPMTELKLQEQLLKNLKLKKDLDAKSAGPANISPVKTPTKSAQDRVLKSSTGMGGGINEAQYTGSMNQLMGILNPGYPMADVRKDLQGGFAPQGAPAPQEEPLPTIETRDQLEAWYKTSKHPNKEYIYQQALKDPELR